MRELAKDFGISNVALAKRFRRLATIGLPVPGETSAQIHLTLVIRRASANRNLNGRFWESREAAAGRNCPFDGEPASGQKLPFAQAAGNPLERSPECRSRIRGRPTIALVTKRAFGPSTGGTITAQS